MNINSILPPPSSAMSKAAASSSAASSSTDSSSGSVNSTFMSLLLTELKSQDPTAPMDTTAMVGQMVSLNQLDQLMSIQSILQNSLGSGATATTPIPGVATAPSNISAVATAPGGSTQTTNGVN